MKLARYFAPVALAAAVFSLPALAVDITGAGATFPYPIYSKWADSYKKTTGASMNYQSIGSGGGIKQITARTVDFGASDLPMKADDLQKNGLIQFPAIIGGVVPVVKLEGIQPGQLKFTGALLGDIFLGKVTKWNDPSIVKLNPGISLPGADIVVVHRSDGSGTTENFTKYLVLAAPAAWKLKSGSTVEWPADTQAGNGNGGVAQIVKSTKGAIGYVDLSDAKATGLKYAAIKNQGGKFVDPTAESVSAAGDGIEVTDKLIFSALDAKGDAAYPITAQSWCMIYAKPKANAGALKAYFKYMLTDGQKLLPEIDFAPIPKSLQDKALAQLDKVSQ